MSEIKVNSIKGVGASTAAITVNNTDGTCTANLSNRQNRNLIINGAMLVAQRGTSSTTSSYSTVDRFKNNHYGIDEAPTQAQVDVASGTAPFTNGFRKAFKVTNGNQTSGAGASDYITIVSHLESQDIAQSGWNYTSTSSFITLSFWVKSSVSQNFYGYIRSITSPSYYQVYETGTLTADTWTKITKTFSGNSNVSFENSTAKGLDVYLPAPYWGTDYTASGTALNTWAAWNGSARQPDSTTTWYTTNDATFEITGVQLEVGSVATDFEHRSFGQELALCQRYFCAYGSTVDNIQNGDRLGCGISTGSNTAIVTIPTGSKLRAFPTVSFSSGVTVNDAAGGPDVSSISRSISYNGHAQIQFVTNPSSLTSGNAAHIRFESTSYLHLSAEL